LQNRAAAWRAVGTSPPQPTGGPGGDLTALNADAWTLRIVPRFDAGKFLVNRGIMAVSKEMSLCEKAQTEFEAFCAIPVVPIGQLFGGKIVAPLTAIVRHLPISFPA